MQCEHCQNWYAEALTSPALLTPDSRLIASSTGRFHFGCIGYTTETAAQVEGYSCDLCQGMGAQPTRSESSFPHRREAYLPFYACSLSVLFDRHSGPVYGLPFGRPHSAERATAAVATCWRDHQGVWSCNQVSISLLQPSVIAGPLSSRARGEGSCRRQARDWRAPRPAASPAEVLPTGRPNSTGQDPGQGACRGTGSGRVVHV